MWKDKIQERYWWHPVKNSLDEFLYELVKAEDEEEVGLYLLGLYRNDEADFKCFTKSKERKIKRLLNFLMKETLRHRVMLSEIASEIGSLKHDSVQDSN